ncbi:MAG: DEAD/DEAH box helicase, partial [Planctomycetota bacterium]
MSEEQFKKLFEQATDGNEPLPYQRRLALGHPLPALLDVPTGLDKTAAAILAWVWRRRFASQAIRNQTPRRLVYCLPMRVLVEQTHRVTIEWLKRLGLFTEETREQHQDWSRPDGDLGDHPIAVDLLLGGEEKSDWALWPERDAILIGTPDMLISRALNRGYAAGRARWPLEFGLLNCDCLWVFDEIQIMDTSLATNLQLDAWRRSLRLRPSRDAFPKVDVEHLPRPCHSLWMSATMAKHWLERAVDFAAKDRVSNTWVNERVEFGPHTFPDGTTEDDQLAPRVQGLFSNQKALAKEPAATLTVPRAKDSQPDVDRYISELARAVEEQHESTTGLVLVILNTVDRARKLYEALPKEGRSNGTIRLIHSRFRPFERARWDTFLRAEPGTPRIIVSTQVVEAGVDLSAKVLFTELAPWASLVQRFGRCARFVHVNEDGTMRNERGRVYWMNLAEDERAALPYSVQELSAARSILQRSSLNDVGLRSLTDVGISLGEHAEKLFPYEPRFVPRDKDLFDLFDTTPDLTGADVDVSRYIRDGEELDVQVFWRDDIPDGGPTRSVRPHRRELCAVKFIAFREFAKTAIRHGGHIWRRRYSKGRNRTSVWEAVDFSNVDQVIYPGQVFLLEKACGGYDRELGWTGKLEDKDFELLLDLETVAKSFAESEDEDGGDLDEINKWLTIQEHTLDVCRKLDVIMPPDGLSASEVKLAMRWSLYDV